MNREAKAAAGVKRWVRESETHTLREEEMIQEEQRERSEPVGS